MSRGKSKRSIRLIAAAQTILQEIQPASVRAVCYQLFIAGLIPNMGKSATNGVSRQLTWAREEGIIPWGWIVDESREAERVTTWENPDEVIDAAVRGYRRDYWQDQPRRVEVWSEKGTVRGTLAPVLEEFGITFRVMHGYASATVVNTIAEESRDNPKPLVALYVGDWDPSGLHMSYVDLPDRLGRYGARFTLCRIALEQQDLHGLPSFDPETKAIDPRYEWFVKEFGTRCYELDAMPPPQLRADVQRGITAFVNQRLWNHAKEIERVEVESMRQFSKSWQATKCGARP
jgi:hypothetical protein